MSAAPGLGPLVARMLERSPVKRPRDAAEALRSLEAVQRELAAGVTGTPARARPASFVEELRRRRVMRALVIYALVAFALLQVAEPVVHGLGLPEWDLRAVVLALALGFPVTTALAWVYDLTRKGVRRTEANPWASTRGPGRARVAAMLGALGLAAAIPGVSWYAWRKRAPAPQATLAPSVAVLPFADLSPDHDQGYFADGVAEEVLNALAQLQGLHVAGRTSSFSFKGKQEDLGEIGRKLGVATALEGSVRKSERRVRVTAQLVSTADGFHLWSQSFDRDLRDIFAVQEEVARAVVAARSRAASWSPRRPRCSGRARSTPTPAPSSA